MRRLTWEEIESQRDTIYRRRPELAVTTEEAAKGFIDEVGFCFLFPVKGLELPSLWEAINGRHRDIPRHHYDYALGLTWGWKDSLPCRKEVFYAKLLRGKPTLVSLFLFPCFYALSDNYGEMEDYLESYRQGRMSEEAKRIYEVLIARGASSTGQLRREAGLWGYQNSSRFDRALLELQRGLRIAKCGIAEDNRWKYSYVYDLVLRWLPEQVKKGVEITRGEAMEVIIKQYLKTVVVATAEGVAHLFEWSLERTGKIIASLLARGEVEEVAVEGAPHTETQAGPWVSLAIKEVP